MSAVLPLALLLAVTATGAETTPAHVVPTDRCGEFFLVPMSAVDDPGRELSLLLDTGASHTVIDADSLERFSGRRIRDGKRVRLPAMRAGEITFRNLGARVRQMDHLQRALGKPLDGILGFPAFRDLLLTIDYPGREVRVRRGSLPPADGKRILHTIKEKRRPVIDLRFGAVSRPVLIDSGSGSGLLLNDSPDLRYAAPPRLVDSSLRIDRVMFRSAARLRDDVQLAGTRLVAPTLAVADGTELLGARILRHFVTTYDQRNRRVMFERAGEGAIEFPAVREIGWALRPGPGGFEVLRVFEGLGARRAGVRPGDLVVAIDGVPVYERDLCDRSEEDRPRIVATVERDGKRRDLSIEIDVVVP